jgi:hypothetical protein
MVINSTKFSIDKLFILFSIAWILQLKIVSNNFLQVNEIDNLKNKPGLVIRFYFEFFLLIISLIRII